MKNGIITESIRTLKFSSEIQSNSELEKAVDNLVEYIFILERFRWKIIEKAALEGFEPVVFIPGETSVEQAIALERKK